MSRCKENEHGHLSTIILLKNYGKRPAYYKLLLW